jgi:hypothetical protein
MSGALPIAVLCFLSVQLTRPFTCCRPAGRHTVLPIKPFAGFGTPAPADTKPGDAHALMRFGVTDVQAAPPLNKPAAAERGAAAGESSAVLQSGKDRKLSGTAGTSAGLGGALPGGELATVFVAVDQPEVSPTAASRRCAFGGAGMSCRMAFNVCSYTRGFALTACSAHSNCV